MPMPLCLQIEMTVIDDHTVEIGMCAHGRSLGGLPWKWNASQLTNIAGPTFPSGYTKVWRVWETALWYQLSSAQGAVRKRSTGQRSGALTTTCLFKTVQSACACSRMVRTRMPALRSQEENLFIAHHQPLATTNELSCKGPSKPASDTPFFMLLV